MGLTVYRVPGWEAEPGLQHGFVGRSGGNSRGAFASLNVSFTVGDDPVSVKDNYRAMKRAVGMDGTPMATMRQRHGDRIIDVAWPCKDAGEGDAMVTDAPGVFIGVLTADCVPIICWGHARRRRLAAVIHAGWRGTLANLAARAVRHIASRYGMRPEELSCALGPAIGGCCYEIGPRVSEPLVGAWGGSAEASLEGRDGRTYLDLRRLNTALLEAAGVPGERIANIGPCTACNPAQLFSYRRVSKSGDGTTGRQASFIGWREAP